MNWVAHPCIQCTHLKIVKAQSEFATSGACNIDSKYDITSNKLLAQLQTSEIFIFSLESLRDPKGSFFSIINI